MREAEREVLSMRPDGHYIHRIRQETRSAGLLIREHEIEHFGCVAHLAAAAVCMKQPRQHVAEQLDACCLVAAGR
jgi:hypothetical protein